MLSHTAPVAPRRFTISTMCCCTKNEDKAGAENERDDERGREQGGSEDRSSEAVEAAAELQEHSGSMDGKWQDFGFCRPKEEVCVNRDQAKATVEPGHTLFARAFRDSCADTGMCPATGASSGFTRPVVPAIINIEYQ